MPFLFHVLLKLQTFIDKDAQRTKFYAKENDMTNKKKSQNDWLDSWQKYEQIVNTKYVASTPTNTIVYEQKIHSKRGYKIFALTWFHI